MTNNVLSGAGIFSGLGNSLNKSGLGNNQQVQGTITAGEVGEFGTRVTINVPDGFAIKTGKRVMIIELD